MKGKKNRDNSRMACLARIAYPLMISLLLSGCSYHDGKFSYVDLTDDNKTKNTVGKQAAQKFWASVRPKTNLSDAHYRLGLHYQQSGEHEKAFGEFTKALQLDRNFCKAYNGIAMTYDIQKRCEQARASYEEALKCAPEEAYVYNNYACSSLLCGDYGKGVDLLQKAESLAKNETRIINNLKIARSIAIRENISEYITTAEIPPQTAATGTKSAPTMPAQEKTPEGSPPKAPEIQEPTEHTSNTTALAIEPNDDQATDEQSLEIAETTEVAVRQLPVAPPEAATAINPVVEINKPEPVSTIPVPVKVAIEVSNGNGTTGMAKRSAEFLRGRGFTVRSITNARHFRFEESVIYYKDEYLQAAKDLAALIPGTQNLERVGALDKSSIGVKVVLGRDLAAIRFPESYAGLADHLQPKQFQVDVITVSNIQVQY